MKKYIIGILSVIILLPLLINFIGNKMVFDSEGEYGEWLSFWGSYLGGVMSGALTLIGVSIGLKNEQRKNLTMRYLQNAKDINGFEDYLDETLEIVRLYKVNNDIQELLDYSLEKCESYIDKFYQIDLEFPKHLEEYKTELFGFRITLDYLESEDLLTRSYSISYHEKHFDSFEKITKDLKNEHKKIQKELL
ncbi:hypothetical protein ACFTQ7_20650 [Lysinibacillus sp. NPDC056959]|uniref:hypothetical protein n=1 Tax=Lysinibacillus sp. NPDC056959 TaxID=3345981 RepID=UPI003644B4FB